VQAVERGGVAMSSGAVQFARLTPELVKIGAIGKLRHDSLLRAGARVPSSDETVSAGPAWNI
jgi:hypothetical protein